MRDKVGVRVMMDLCQRVLDGTGMLYKWKTCVIVPILKKSCGSCRSGKLLENTLKIVQRVLERYIGRLSNSSEMQLEFVQKTVDAISQFIVKGMQEEYRKKKKKVICVLLILKRYVIGFHEK